MKFATVKAAASFDAVLAHYGLQCSKGGQVKVLCPFHDDTKPSLSVNKEEKIFFCHGCKEKGDIIEFVALMEKCSAYQAAKTLSQLTGATESDEKPKDREKPISEKKAPQKRKLGFTLPLTAHPYLSKRGIPIEEQKRLGLGICEQGSMAARACFPIRNLDGDIEAYAGRHIVGEEPKWLLPKKYEKGLYDIFRVKEMQHLIIVENPFSVHRLATLRLPAVACFGSCLTEHQTAMLEELPNLRYITLLFDGDEAGYEGMVKSLPLISEHWWARMVVLENGQPDTVDESVLRRRFNR